MAAAGARGRPRLRVPRPGSRPPQHPAPTPSPPDTHTPCFLSGSGWAAAALALQGRPQPPASSVR